MQHVQAVLLRPLEHSLFGKAEKCEIHVPSVSVLGYIKSPREASGWTTSRSQQYSPGPFRIPGNAVAASCFPNLYHRFVRNYRSVAAPLPALTSVKKPFEWSPEADTTFQALKQRFTWPQFHRCQSCPRGPSLIRSSTPAPFSLYSHQPKGTTTLGTASCLQ